MSTRKKESFLFGRKWSNGGKAKQEEKKRKKKNQKKKITQSTKANPPTAVPQQQTCWCCPLSPLQSCAACRGLLVWRMWKRHGLLGCFRSLQRSGILRSHICNSACFESPSDGEQILAVAVASHTHSAYHYCFRSPQRSGISRSHICNSACSERPSDGEPDSPGNQYLLLVRRFFGARGTSGLLARSTYPVP